MRYRPISYSDSSGSLPEAFPIPNSSYLYTKKVGATGLLNERGASPVVFRLFGPSGDVCRFVSIGAIPKRRIFDSDLRLEVVLEILKIALLRSDYIERQEMLCNDKNLLNGNNGFVPTSTDQSNVHATGNHRPSTGSSLACSQLSPLPPLGESGGFLLSVPFSLPAPNRALFRAGEPSSSR